MRGRALQRAAALYVELGRHGGAGRADFHRIRRCQRLRSDQVALPGRRFDLFPDVVRRVIPFQVVLLPMARTLGLLGMAGTVPGLVLVHVVYGLAFTTLFFRNFFISVSDGIVQAAKIDGARFVKIFFQIVLPMAVPASVVTVIWQFTQIWNDFLFGIAFTVGDSNPVTIALNNIVNTSTGVKEYNVDMAAAILAALPTLLVYVVAGNYFVRGLAAGALKG
jgi:glucose/mannose transport system permease protein